MVLYLERTLDSPPAADALRACGWSPDRRVETTPQVDALAKQGYLPQPAAVDVLKSFLGLEIKGRRSVPGCRQGASRMEFRPCRADGQYENVRDYVEKLVEEPVFPLGSVDGLELVLMGASGRVYGHALWWVFERGGDFDEFLFQLLMRRKDPVLLWQAPGKPRPWWLTRESAWPKCPCP
ncbi:SUKH-3 domain-containing protein [Salininema proteolyticum]|uniref:SUKH-3 domain-containing protein n=1 Tax=Salininema proteolyticum TaxID=1607685 RepID=A0ABV8TSG9_9ACTN